MTRESCLTLLILLLAACVAPSQATLPTPATTPGSGPGLEPSSLINPLDAAECEILSTELLGIFGGEVERSEAPYKDMITTRSGRACRLELRGNGVQVGTFGEATTKLHDLLKGRGWEEDTRYVADGPTGSMLGFRQDNRLCIAEVQWEPTADAECPADQPISACELTPEQQLFTIRLTCVQQ